MPYTYTYNNHTPFTPLAKYKTCWNYQNHMPIYRIIDVVSEIELEDLYEDVGEAKSWRVGRWVVDVILGARVFGGERVLSTKVFGVKEFGEAERFDRGERLARGEAMTWIWARWLGVLRVDGEFLKELEEGGGEVVTGSEGVEMG